MPHFVHEIPVRYADTDAQGRVFFANYLTYFDEAMTGYLHAIGYPPARVAADGVDFMYVDAQCSYRGGAVFEDRVQVQFVVTQIGRTSISAAVEAHVAGAVIATGALVFVCVSTTENQKVPVPEGLRDAIASFQGGAPG